VTTEQVLLPLGNAAVFTGLTLSIGCVALYWLVLESRDGAVVGSAARVGAGASGLLLIGLALVFTAQLLAFNLPPDPMLPDARALIGLPWGRVFSVQSVLALLTAVGFLGAGRPGGSWALLALLALALAVTPAFAGHAGADDPKALSVAADAVHVLCAGLWLGTLAALALTSRPFRPESAPLLLRRVRRFSKLGLTAAPVLLLSGSASAWLRLGRLGELWGSTYGRVLLVKLVVFAGVALAGLFNWRRATPQLAASGDPEVLRRSMRNELLLALAVVVITALLVTTPPPGEG
jgi:putative copper resistance protein D